MAVWPGRSDDAEPPSGDGGDDETQGGRPMMMTTEDRALLLALAEAAEGLMRMRAEQVRGAPPAGGGAPGRGPDDAEAAAAYAAGLADRIRTTRQAVFPS